MKLFEIDTQTRVVDLNKEWISTIKEFKRLITRDKGSEGDHDGRKKFKAIKEFTFIYHFCDYRSKYLNYSENDKLIECLRNAELEEDEKILDKDEALLAAVIKYKSLQETPALKVLAEVKETLHSAHRVVKKMREKLEAELTKIDIEAVIEEDGDGKKKVKIDPVTKISNYLTSIMDIANRIPDSIEAIEKQEEKVKKELGEEVMIRGDGKTGVREDGNVRKLTARNNMFQ